jgi:hypothetical protein
LVLEGELGSGFGIKKRAFAGQPVDFASRDPRSGRLLAAAIPAADGCSRP